MGLIHFLLKLVDGHAAGKTSQSRINGRRRPLPDQRWKAAPVKSSPQRIQRRNPSSAMGKGSGGRGGFIAYHGTPQVSNAKSILRHGWMVGSGNAHGDGVYLSKDIRVAQSYAGTGGVILKCWVAPKRCARWHGSLPTRYQKWCSERNIPQDNSARTAFLLQQGFHILMVDNDTFVVLMPQYANHAAWKRKIEGLKVLSVHSASDNRRIRI